MCGAPTELDSYTEVLTEGDKNNGMKMLIMMMMTVLYNYHNYDIMSV